MLVSLVIKETFSLECETEEKDLKEYLRLKGVDVYTTMDDLESSLGENDE